MKFLWSVVIVGSLLGGLLTMYALFGAETAPQEAAAAAMGAALAVVPYCLARAVSMIQRDSKQIVTNPHSVNKIEG